MNRFDYVKYDKTANDLGQEPKARFSSLSKKVDEYLTSPRAKALVQTKLEEAYMWVGKAIRDDQIARTPANTELQEERSNS